MDIARTTPDALGPLETALDREFVTRRGRSGTLRARYPLAFGATCEFLVSRQDGHARACLAGRRVVWRDPAGDRHGVMIGLVYTVPEARGRGLGTALVRAALEIFAAEGCDFAVLWSRLAGFYESAGFRRADCGVLGRATGEAGISGPPPGEPLVRLSAAELAALERLRRTGGEAGIDRPAAAWRTTPLPADEVRVLRSGPPADPAAYLLFGCAADRRIVYEIAGDPSAGAALWQALCAGTAAILVNDRRGSPSQRRLDAHAAIAWEAQRLACWAPLSPAMHACDFADWYVPYLDRI